jgi:hypothetical protein
MNWQGPEFVVTIIAMSMAAWVITSWIRARHGYPVENEWGGMVSKSDPDADRKIALLSSENDKLVGKIIRLEERVAVLERIATDAPARLSSEIEQLRSPAN